MKTTITLLLTILSFGYIQAQAPAIQWQKSFGGTSGDLAQSIQLTVDGGYIIAGISTSIGGDVTGNHGGADYWVVKLDAIGTIQWQKSFGGLVQDYGISIQTTSDGGYVLAGASESNNGDATVNHGALDYWVVKLDAIGNIQWQKSFGGSGSDYGTYIQTASDGGYIVGGVSNSTGGDVTGNHNSTDSWILKLDTIGNIQWQKSLGGLGDDSVNSIQNTADGGYIVAGDSNSIDGDITGNHGGFDYWVVKLDATGNIQWQKSLGGSGNDYGTSIQITVDGGYIIAGDSNSTNGDVTGNHGAEDYWVVKIDSAGTIQWQKSFGGLALDKAQSIITTPDDGYIVAGYSSSSDGDVAVNQGWYDYWLIKLDAIGTIQWQKSMGGSSIDRAQSIQFTSDVGYIIAGHTYSNNGDVSGNHGNYDFWIVKLGSELAIPAYEKQGIVIYPNPVCDVLQIQTPTNTTITSAKIIAINGQVVLEHTQNSNTINVENLAQGVYILEAYSGEEKYTSKFVKE